MLQQQHGESCIHAARDFLELNLDEVLHQQALFQLKLALYRNEGYLQVYNGLEQLQVAILGLR